MSIVNIVSLLGGLGLFLYGVHLMGEGLGRIAGDKLQVVLYKLTDILVNDIIIYCERISDHCSNLAVALIELTNDDFDVHNYIESLKSSKDNDFERYFREYSQKYHI